MDNLDKLRFGSTTTNWLGSNKLESIRSSSRVSAPVSERLRFRLSSSEDSPSPAQPRRAKPRRSHMRDSSESEQEAPKQPRRSSRIQERGPRRKFEFSESEISEDSNEEEEAAPRRLQKLKLRSSSEEEEISDSSSSEEEISVRRPKPQTKAPATASSRRRVQSSDEEDGDPDSDSAAESEISSHYSEVEEVEEEIVEKILGICAPGNLYLVKFKGRSYRACRWESGNFFQDVPSDKRSWKLRNFLSKASDDVRVRSTGDVAALFDQANLQPEKILGERRRAGGLSHLVKWQSLNYADATWETGVGGPDGSSSGNFLGLDPIDWTSLLADWRVRKDSAGRLAREVSEISEDARRRGWLADVLSEELTPQKMFADILEPVAESEISSDVNRRLYTYQQAPAGESLQIFEFQREGVNWLLFNWAQRRNVCLADSMGCGKTIQTAVFLAQLRKWLLLTQKTTQTQTQTRVRFLVVSPMSTLENWKREMTKWTGLSVAVLQGGRRDRGVALKWDAGSAEVVITSYETLAVEEAFFFGGGRGGVGVETPWTAVVLDEAHRLKGVKSKMRQTVEAIPAGYRLLLTGTPVQNSLGELWSLLNLADARSFPSLEGFLAEYSLLEGGAENSVRLQEKIRPYLLQRKKEEVLSHLVPEKDEIIVSVELTRLQKLVYRGIYEKNLHLLTAAASGGGGGAAAANMHMELRKVCNHPFLVLSEAETAASASLAEAAYGEEDPNVQLVKTSGKLVFLDKLIAKAQMQKTKILVFSQFTMMLDLIEHWLRATYSRTPATRGAAGGSSRDSDSASGGWSGVALERLDGGVKSLKERQQAIDRFNGLQGQAAVFLLSTRSGGVGLNLASAQTVVLLDHDWNAQNDLQAIARAHRIGSQSRVTVFRLVSRGSYEEVILKRAGQKLGLEMALMSGASTPPLGGGGAGSVASGGRAKKEELELLLKEGVFGAVLAGADSEEDRKFIAEDLESILQSRATHVALQKGGESEIGRSGGGGGAGALFSRAVFKMAETENMPDISDPDFWLKVQSSGNLQAKQNRGEAGGKDGEDAELPAVRKTRVARNKRQTDETSEEEEISEQEEISEDENEHGTAMTQRVKSLVKYASNFGLWREEEEISRWTARAKQYMEENWPKRAPKQKTAALSGNFDLAQEISVFIAAALRGMKVARNKDDAAQTLQLRESEISAVVGKALKYLAVPDAACGGDYLGRLEIRSPEMAGSGVAFSDHILNAITTAEFGKLKATLDALEFFEDIGNIKKFPIYKKTTKTQPEVWTSEDDSKLVAAVLEGGREGVGNFFQEVSKHFLTLRLNQIAKKCSLARMKVLEISVLNAGLPETLFEQVLKATGFAWTRKFVQLEILGAQLEQVALDSLKQKFPSGAATEAEDKNYWKQKFPGVSDLDEFARTYVDALIDALGWKGETQKAAVKKLLKPNSEKFQIEISREDAFRAMWRLQTLQFARRLMRESEISSVDSLAPAEVQTALTFAGTRGFEALTSEQISGFVKLVYMLVKDAKDEGKRPAPGDQPEKTGKANASASKAKKQRTIIEALASMKPLD